MLGRLVHIAIAVPNIIKAIAFYKNILGADVSSVENYIEHGVSAAFVQLNNTKIELLQPLGEHSPIKYFLEKNPLGGMHHLCIEVANLEETMNKLSASGVSFLGDEIPKLGADGKRVIFIHPSDMYGTLLELQSSL